MRRLERNASELESLNDRLIAKANRDWLTGLYNVARYDGEEFVLLIPETSVEGAMLYAERLRASVSQHRFEDDSGKPLGRVTISVGVASFPEHATDSNSLIEIADRALYLAKRQGRNAIRSADEVACEQSVPAANS